MENVVKTTVACQWTGENSAEVLQTVQSVTPVSGNIWSIVSEDEWTLTLRETNGFNYGNWLLYLNQWIVVTPSFGVEARLSDTEYRAQYSVVAFPQ